MVDAMHSGVVTSHASADDKIPMSWLVALFVGALVLRLVCFTGMIASDDLGYFRFASQIADGSYTPYLHHYAVRYGLIAPVGLVYAIFGIGEFTSVVLPLLGSSLSVVLIALIGQRLFNRNTGLIAALLYLTFPLQLHYSTILVPESVAECYVLLAVLLHINKEARSPFMNGVFSGMLIGVAYITKEPAIFLAPVLFFDAVFNKRWQHAFALFVGTTLVMGIEFSYYYATTGDLMFRQHALAAHNANIQSNPNEIIADLNYRLFKTYPRMMLVPDKDFGIHSLVAIICTAIAIVAGLKRDKRTWFLAIWIVIPWLYINFGSSSFKEYIALPAAPRYIEFAYPPLFLGAGWLLSRTMNNRPSFKIPVQLLIVVVAVVGLACGYITRGTGYGTAIVAKLQDISTQSGFKSSGCASIDGTPRQIEVWSGVLNMYNGRIVTDCGGRQPDVIIAADASASPYVAARGTKP